MAMPTTQDPIEPDSLENLRRDIAELKAAMAELKAAVVPQPNEAQAQDVQSARDQWLKSLTPHQRDVIRPFMDADWNWIPERLEKARDELKAAIENLFGPLRPLKKTRDELKAAILEREYVVFPAPRTSSWSTAKRMKVCPWCRALVEVGDFGHDKGCLWLALKDEDKRD